MTEATLRQLLVDADAAADLPAASRDLAGSIRLRPRRRRAMQFTSTSIMLAVALLLLPLLRTTEKRPMAIDPSKAQAELALVRLRADAQQSTVNRLASYQHTLALRAIAARKIEVGRP